MDREHKHELLIQSIDYLSHERDFHVEKSTDTNRLWETFRALVNTRPAEPAQNDFLQLQDELLQGMIAEKGIATLEDTSASPLNERVSLWRGDITTLAVDGIVNAANNQMLGCHVPGHKCIDNAIHTFAGVQLRLECAAFMAKQGHPEPTGSAKITKAYNLPSQYILHTVGPITTGAPTQAQCDELASCYTSCLDLAEQKGLRSLAFCCVSTGMFGFPDQKAAEIAVATVLEWLSAHPTSPMHVVFDVYLSTDETIYKELLKLA
ncbi:MAG: protein-ADP-ribose hydrolase [Atopobiaceae bacterium]|nr:protein-ADP-ribose hydrolase [Atopobiaceae bacterium]